VVVVRVRIGDPVVEQGPGPEERVPVSRDGIDVLVDSAVLQLAIDGATRDVLRLAPPKLIVDVVIREAADDDRRGRGRIEVDGGPEAAPFTRDGIVAELQVVEASPVRIVELDILEAPAVPLEVTEQNDAERLVEEAVGERQATLAARISRDPGVVVRGVE